MASRQPRTSTSQISRLVTSNVSSPSERCGKGRTRASNCLGVRYSRYWVRVRGCPRQVAL
eukprot:scaffold165897_cov16-Prasinocladus_malaysianus.AAC.1